MLSFLLIFTFLAKHSLAFEISICENETNIISCSPEIIEIKSAFFGRDNPVSCPKDGYDNATKCESENATEIVQHKCEGSQSCRLNADTDIFGDPCLEVYKYLRVSYDCSSDEKETDKAVHGKRSVRSAVIVDPSTVINIYPSFSKLRKPVAFSYMGKVPDEKSKNDKVLAKVPDKVLDKVPDKVSNEDRENITEEDSKKITDETPDEDPEMIIEEVLKTLDMIINISEKANKTIGEAPDKEIKKVFDEVLDEVFDEVLDEVSDKGLTKILEDLVDEDRDTVSDNVPDDVFEHNFYDLFKDQDDFDMDLDESSDDREKRSGKTGSDEFSKYYPLITHMVEEVIESLQEEK